MTKEIILRVAAVSDILTRAASIMIATEFGGYFRIDGFGGYTFADGQTIGTPAVSWHIGTAAKDSARFEFVARFAAEYCKAGEQESIYFLDLDGVAYLAFADGRIAPVD